MTREQMLERLMRMALNGEDMKLPLIAQVDTTVHDERYKYKIRTETAYYEVTFCCEGSLETKHGKHGQIICKPFFPTLD